MMMKTNEMNKSFEDLSVAELLELDNERVSEEKVEEIWLNPNIDRIDALGDSSFFLGYTWLSCTLITGQEMDIYCKY